MGNLVNGVAISDAGPTEVIGNVIASNGVSGVATYAAQPIYVEYNYIGTDPDQDPNLGNRGDGVEFTYTTGLIQGNAIGSNGTNGVALLNSPTNTIQGNFIGTDANGKDTVLPNQGNGISIESNAGQVSSNEDVVLNTISNNVGNGVEVQGVASGVILTQNLIGGTTLPGLLATVGNRKDGVLLDDVTPPGGSTSPSVVLSGNGVYDNGNDGLQVIGGGSFTSTSDSFTTNSGDGVEFDSGATGNTLLDDSILGNRAFGVLINQSPDNTLTGVTIENNTGQGLDIIESPGIVITGGTDTGNNEGGIATPFV
jgi:hypothetical protein